jgi:hypothetical protein
MNHDTTKEVRKEIEQIYAQYEKEAREIEKEKQVILDRLRTKVAQKKLNQIAEKKHE